MSDFVWMIPSFYGDVRLQETDAGTRVEYEKTTGSERAALKTLREHAIEKKWIGVGAALDLPADAGAFDLTVGIGSVQKILTHALKPDRRIVSVLYKDGVVEEIVEAETKKGVVVTEKGERKTKGAKAASVAAPTRGCPEPDFIKAEIRATEVLLAFLDDEQREDFARYNRFVTIGASGCRYMVTSRHARDELATYHRSLYDLGLDYPICCHEWLTPAAEECLTLHLLVQLPEWEQWIRQRPNTIDEREP